MPFIFKIKHLVLSIFTALVLSSCSAAPPAPINLVGMKTCLGIDEKLMPIEVTGSFYDGVKKIYCWFQWEKSRVPLTITARWTFTTDNVHILDYNFEIPRKDGFGGVSLVMPEGKKLPLGQYRIDLLYGDKVLKSLNFTLDLAPISYFQITGPTSITAGESGNLTIHAYDRYGNPATGYNGPHSLIFSGINQSPNGNTAQINGVNMGNGVNVTFNAGVSDENSIKFVPYKAENATLNVSEGSFNSSGRGLALSVLPGVTRELFFVRGPSNGTAGAAISPAITVQIKDAFGNPRIEDNSTQVNLSLKDNPGNGILLGTSTQKVQQGVASFTDLSINKAAEGYSLVASFEDSISSPSGKFNIGPSGASYLTIKGDSSMIAGTTNELTISAYDAYDNLATGYTGSHGLVFSGLSASPNGSIPTVESIKLGQTVQVNFTDGVSNANAATLSAFNAENAVLNVSEASIHSNGHGLNLTVNPSANDNLTFLQGPTNGNVNRFIVPSVKVQIRDVYNNIKTQDNGTTVTIALKDNPRNATLNGTLTQSSAGGIVVFDDLSINKIASGYVLKAISEGLTETISESFNIDKKQN